MSRIFIKECGIGTLFVLVSPCFMENVVVTCKIGSFLCSLDNLLQKNVNVFFFFEIKFQNGTHLKKRAIFDLLFTFFSHQGEVTKIPSVHISLIYIHVFCSPYRLFLPHQFWKKKKYKFIRYGFSLVWVLVLILIRAILEQSITKWWAKFKLECLLLICVYTNAKYIVICKPRTLNDRGEDSLQYRNGKKHCFLARAILLLIGKIIITW